MTDRLPWGILTGIRPAKIVQEMLGRGIPRDDILRILNGHYGIAPDKAELLYTVAKTESDILIRTPSDAVSLYIGIPFCTTRCLYCSFTSNPIKRYERHIGLYFDALAREMRLVEDIINRNGYKIQSIYIGGGTPTSVELSILKGLLESVECVFDLRHLEEYTLEAGRPDTIDKDKLETIKKSRVTRISINPQTMNNKTLCVIGRSHTAEDTVNAFHLARSMGFGHINMDIIVGLPGEDLAMFENTLRQIDRLRPESLTVHTMAMKRASRLNEYKADYPLIGSEEASAMVDMAYRYAEGMGMHPYYLYRQKNILGNLENTGYCKPGCESIYNVQIMEEKQTIIALGAGGVTKVVYPAENRIERAFNVKDVEEYISRLNEMVERKRKLLMQ